MTGSFSQPYERMKINSSSPSATGIHVILSSFIRFLRSSVKEPFRGLQKVMKNTEITMSEAATKVLAVKDSPPNAHPRKTATTGLTKAWVETQAGVQTLNNHMYALKPANDPKRIK